MAATSPSQRRPASSFDRKFDARAVEAESDEEITAVDRLDPV
jgi:hypothetical protein